jgi:hypothetical protein
MLEWGDGFKIDAFLGMLIGGSILRAIFICSGRKMHTLQLTSIAI